MIDREFTFTDSKLYNLIIQTMALADEYEQQHGYSHNDAQHQAANDTLEGLHEAAALKATRQGDER